MRRYEPKPWDIRRCDMIHADEGEYVLYCDAQTEIERLNNALTEAANQIGDLATRLGQAKGRLDASELVGVVEGWKARAETAETERDEARAQVAAAYELAAQVKVFMAEEGGFLTRVPLLPETKATIRALTPADAQAALEAYGLEKMREGMMRAAALFPVGSRDGEAISSTILDEMEKLNVRT